MKQFTPIVFVAILSVLFQQASVAQELGANFNHDPELIDIPLLKRTGVDWIRTTPYFFDYHFGKKQAATDTALQKILDAKAAGYKVAFGFRFDFRRYRVRIPVAGSAAEDSIFTTVRSVLKRIGPAIDMFKLGNEPNLETMPADMQRSADGKVPLVEFSKRLLEQVVIPYYSSLGKRLPPVYVGSLPRLFLKEEQQNAGVRGLIELAQNHTNIAGLSVHLHVSDSAEMKQALEFARSIMPAKPIIVPEFSLFRLYNRHTTDRLGSTSEGRAFAKRYNYSDTLLLYKWYSKANSHGVSSKEWEDLFASRSWFIPNMMRTFYRHFQQYGVVLATYGFVSQSAPQNMRPDSPTWFINPLWPMKSLLPDASGAPVPNPLWYNDFIELMELGKKSTASKQK